jgi:Domain of unknown function (DUF4350)
MLERLMTLACALGALLLFGTLFLREDAFTERRVARPTSTESSDNGLLGLMSWLRAEGVTSVSLRERFVTLARRPDLEPTGNLLIVTLPAAMNFRNDELIALDRWVSSGNTLLVLAALLDRPSWAQSPLMMKNDLQLLTGLRVVWTTEEADRAQAAASERTGGGAKQGTQARRSAHRDDPDLARIVQSVAGAPQPRRSSLLPNRAHPYFIGVSRALAFSDYPPRESAVSIPRDGFALSLAHQGETGADAFWIRPEGAGAVLVSAFGSLFTNRALGAADNARLLANLIGATVSPRGAVIFDDEHQGLSAAYDPAKFYRDRRLYATLAVIAAVWLAWVLGATQLQMPKLRAPAPREAELVRTSGLFLARVLRPAAAARRMFEQFLQRLDRALGQPSAADPAQRWRWLENHPRLARADVAQLRQWHAAAYADRRVPLVRLHNLIVRTERQLAA